jgi:CRP-like cAMP-binding protein
MAAPVELLRNVALLQGLDERALASIAALAQRKQYNARDVVVQQGDPGGELFVIVTGHLKVVSGGADGRDIALNIMGPGEVFGEISLLDGEPRSATAAALDSCELLAIHREPSMRFLESSPKTAIELLRVLTFRVRRLTERSDDVAFLRVGGRLAKRIADLVEKYGHERADGSVRLPFKLSQQEIGELVSATRETANKQLKAWEQEGLISQQNGHLVVQDLTRLLNQVD